MLSSKDAVRIVRLFDAGLSLRAISGTTGLARTTVRRVLARRGRLPEGELGLRAQPAYEEFSVAPNTSPAHNTPETGSAEEGAARANELAVQGLYNVKCPVFTRPPERCPECGTLCYMPCLACRLRLHQQQLRRREAPDQRADAEFEAKR